MKTWPTRAIEFENGTVANLTASRASYTALRKMRIWSTEGYASLDFAAKSGNAGPAVRRVPERPARPGWSRSQPAHGGARAPFRQGTASGPGPDRRPRATGTRDRRLRARPSRRDAPRVSGDDALRAMRLADQILKSLNAHHWDGDASVTPLPAQPVESTSVLRGPHAWRLKNRRQNPSAAGH